MRPNSSQPEPLDPRPSQPVTDPAVDLARWEGEGGNPTLLYPVVRLDLAGELTEQSGPEEGHHSKTLVEYPELKLVLVTLAPGASMGEHVAHGHVTFQTLEGHVHVKLGNSMADLPVGCVVCLGPAAPHELVAVERSAVLLTVAAPLTH